MKILFVIGILLMVCRYSYVIYEAFQSFNTYSGSWGAPPKTKMDFEQWRDLYYVNPSRYNLDNRSEVNLIFTSPRKESWMSYEKVQIVFSFVDYIKFLFFVSELRNQENKINKQNKDIQENESLKKILLVAQYDIERLKRESEEEIQKAKDAIAESATKGKVSPQFIEALDLELQQEKFGKFGGVYRYRKEIIK